VSGLLLQTKLRVPRPRPGLVPRPRLIARLNKALTLGRNLTLISAPAGFGKTTLVCEWLDRLDRACAWLSLDEADNDPARFLSYLLASLNGIDPDIGQRAVAMLQSPQPPASDALLISLINDIAATPEPFILVLDDYHLIHARSIHQQIAFLVEQLPPQMHLIIATREEPFLPLSRLRARGQVTEIGQADLRLTIQEAADFFGQTMGLDLSPADVATLHRRAEGWIAGLQLAALSLQGTQDAGRFVQSFAGSQRYILDYLMDEVLQQQPADVQDFMLQTSILDRFDASLCDAICCAEPGSQGKGDSRQILYRLEQANLFLVPLDEFRQWYRYHHLFTDLLRHRLVVEGRHDASLLHRRASRWYADNGLLEDAVRHALAASDWELAASLILDVSDGMLKRGEVVTLLGWFQALPEAFVRASPQLCVEASWPLILSEQIDAAESYLAIAEESIPDHDNLSLPGRIAVTRAYIARMRGDSARVIDLSEQALALLPEDDVSSRSIVAVNLGMTQWFRGRLAEAEQALLEAGRSAREPGNQYVRWAASVFLTKIEIARGKMQSAAESCRRFVESEGHSPLAPVAHYDLGRLLYEWNDLQSAADHVRRGIELARQNGNVEFEFGGYSTLAYIKQAQGDSVAAHAALQSAKLLSEHPDIPPPTRLYNLVSQVIVAQAQGDLDTASRVAERFPATPQEAGSFPDYLRLSLAWAHLLLAAGQRETAAKRLAQLHDLAIQTGWRAAAVQARALQTLAAPTPEEALGFLGQALAQAEPEGYVRTFLDGGERMAALLREAASIGMAPSYVAKLRAAFAGLDQVRTRAPLASEQPLIDPLSDRELEILSLLAAGLTYREIAQALFVSVNTIKTHVRNIYGKLGARRRHEATSKAIDLGLIS
jgi:LuxR family maltose regulon positive regulatory protein